MKRYLLPLAVCAAMAVPAHADDAEISYGQCVALVQKNPSVAEERARAWRNVGGGAAATHCRALALTALKRYPDAARELEALARDPAVTDSGDRAALYDQAGNAWLLAGLGSDAVRDFSAALAGAPNDIDIITDRARAHALLKDWYGAEADLSMALLQDQNRPDLLVLRASARRALGEKTEAATDIVRALALYPDYPAALVERGEMKYEVGDSEGARADWKKAAASREGDAAEDARHDLEALGPEQKPPH
jgi:tetratricopeptide (TPR) repeat protein